MAVIQVIMAFAFVYYAMDWPGQIYIVTVFIGIGLGAQWAIAPASASELFGLKSFSALYNFIAMGCPAGSVIFSGIIASGIYDCYAEKQGGLQEKYGEESLTCVVVLVQYATLSFIGSWLGFAWLLSAEK
ncbi:hypothetical protein Dsin_030426 [Dipteronia sinensis]|uniref:NFD4 C-terminal domain-containing protein n=1 Tax=Dipteronia sinensis TaxID=43782 RepID=A0AAE0DSF3_9ROSI|nr:hypothetical protein Dsin_030426 [Dipteronia sinensis]